MDVHWGCAGGVVLGGLGLPSLVVEPLEAAQHEEVVGPLAKVGPAVALECTVSIVGSHHNHTEANLGHRDLRLAHAVSGATLARPAGIPLLALHVDVGRWDRVLGRAAR